MDVPGEAPLALAATTALPTDPNTVTHLEPSHARPDLVDTTHNLMARHHREREHAEVVVDRVNIGMAHPAMRHPHPHLTIPQRCRIEHDAFEATPDSLRCVTNDG
ncbi:MAG: hypothetical protein MUQ27_09075 [Acidimicrobiia bacterium]|nr:hypothetical protein [Acidimicrobiia bacterium]